MRRRPSADAIDDTADLLAAAAEARVFDLMPREEARDWLNRRGWTSPRYLEALLENRHAWARVRDDDVPDPRVLPRPLESPDYVDERTGDVWASTEAWVTGVRRWRADHTAVWDDGFGGVS